MNKHPTEPSEAMLNAGRFAHDASWRETTTVQIKHIYAAMKALDPDFATRTDSERMARANETLGAWMSAALDDPKVCPAMKADIEEWFAALTPSQSPKRFTDEQIKAVLGCGLGASLTSSPDAVELLRRALDAGHEWVVDAANESKGEGDIVFINAMRDIKLIERALASLTPSQSDPIEHCSKGEA